MIDLENMKEAHRNSYEKCIRSQYHRKFTDNHGKSWKVHGKSLKITENHRKLRKIMGCRVGGDFLVKIIDRNKFLVALITVHCVDRSAD